MTTLTIYAEHDAKTPLARHTEFAAIRDALAQIGVEFERWEASQPLSPTASQEEVMAAYRTSIDTLVRKYGFQSVDVVSMHPDHPQAEAARGKFLSEHTHTDFETRFFVDGSGAFYIRKNGKVYMLVCTRGDLVNLPANTTHWFDMGPRPNFKAIRFFRIPDGWVGHFTGDPIADRFPKYEAMV
ncbi:acireductone dioxygenase apoprotein [Fontimonas thermophila]|uniref:Acireductone dioxygenase n=1 Tax=Fontimonas thermophila TaxID=1076937 RepID=A0A1I2K7W2_9GAMM|nr:cupin [Fontimonas thermophila]SFF63014.1 acireductone dioxygenase apoprotein [Fontimonas thermophila]